MLHRRSCFQAKNQCHDIEVAAVSFGRGPGNGVLVR